MSIKRQGRSASGFISFTLSLAVLALITAAASLTYTARPAYAQTIPNLTGSFPSSRSDGSLQTLTLHQVSAGGNVVGNLTTWWPGTLYYWTSYVSGSISGSTLTMTWTITNSVMPSGTVACGETEPMTLATSGGGVTTATVPSYHPCGGSSTINSYPFTLTGWGKNYGGDGTSGGPSVYCTSCGPGALVGGIADVATGNILEPTTDYATAGPNKLSLVRYYNSYQTLTRANVFGGGTLYHFGPVPNVTSNFDLYLGVNSAGTQVTSYRPDGQQLTFNL